ncbi:hypothetical protein PR202_ga30306 [Eleusine coracana subsp. coracana]|uniref:KIB1-4 beta-propeller domain-containing protein n=1 Tax=Eleusine coracana subsp. coracana TaxID=191504 RepID=A0AAV5DNG1_ELECO|nr:hypothetical protein PR202_ga30306 [Eleusine coracana subsp. coracana]
MTEWGHRRQEWRLKRQPAAEPAVRRRQEWRLKRHLSPKSTTTSSEAAHQVIIGTRRLVDFPLEIVAEIHSRLGFLDRLNFATVLGVHAARRLLSTEAPCLLLPGEATEKSTFFSVADRLLSTEAPLAQHGGAMLTTGTIPFGYRSLVVKLRDFAKIRYGGQPAATGFIQGVSYSISGWQMRKWFYRKFGAPAFATADDPAWRLAMSPDGVEDAIHHNGRFYSVTYSGIVEAWDRHAETGEYRSTAVGPRLLVGEGVHHDVRRKYIAAAPDGRLMAVLKEYKKLMRTYDNQPIPVFKSSAARISAGCVYYTDDELGKASMRLEQDSYSSPVYRSSIDADHCCYELQDLGVYNLKDGKVGRVEGLPKHKCWPPPAWFTPSV